MTYASQQDLIDRFGELELIQLTDRADPPAGAFDATVIAKALADADATIDGYLAGAGLALPLATTPNLVNRLAGDVARYFYHAAQATETVRQNYEDALAMLKLIASGAIKLQVGGAIEEGGENLPQSQGGPRVFSRDKMKGY